MLWVWPFLPLIKRIHFWLNHFTFLNSFWNRVLTVCFQTWYFNTSPTNGFTIDWTVLQVLLLYITNYEKSDWSRALNQFTIACELDMINVISAADISTSAWLLSPLGCSPQKQNGSTLRFCFWGWFMWKMYNKTIIEFNFRMISWVIKPSCLCYLW